MAAFVLRNNGIELYYAGLCGKQSRSNTSPRLPSIVLFARGNQFLSSYTGGLGDTLLDCHFVGMGILRSSRSSRSGAIDANPLVWLDRRGRRIRSRRGPTVLWHTDSVAGKRSESNYFVKIVCRIGREHSNAQAIELLQEDLSWATAT